MVYENTTGITQTAKQLQTKKMSKGGTTGGHNGVNQIGNQIS